MVQDGQSQRCARPADPVASRGVSDGRNLLSHHAVRNAAHCRVFGFYFITNQCVLLTFKVNVLKLRSVSGCGAGSAAAGTLTLVADEEAHAGPAAVRGEEQRQEGAGADQKVRRLRAVELADERRRGGRPVAHLQGVVVHLGLKPADR